MELSDLSLLVRFLVPFDVVSLALFSASGLAPLLASLKLLLELLVMIMLVDDATKGRVPMMMAGTGTGSVLIRFLSICKPLLLKRIFFNLFFTLSLVLLLSAAWVS